MYKSISFFLKVFTSSIPFFFKVFTSSIFILYVLKINSDSELNLHNLQLEQIHRRGKIHVLQAVRTEHKNEINVACTEQCFTSFFLQRRKLLIK